MGISAREMDMYINVKEYSWRLIAASGMTITTLWCGLKHYSAWKTQQQKVELPSKKLLLPKQVTP